MDPNDEASLGGDPDARRHRPGRRSGPSASRGHLGPPASRAAPAGGMAARPVAGTDHPSGSRGTRPDRGLRPVNDDRGAVLHLRAAGAHPDRHPGLEQRPDSPTRSTCRTSPDRFSRARSRVEVRHSAIVGAIFVLVSATSLSRALDPRLRQHLGTPATPDQPGLGVALAGRGPRASRSPSSSSARRASHSRSCRHESCGPGSLSFSWDVAVAAFVPWALLAGTVRARLLVPGALLFALLMIAVRPATQAWLPGALEASADRYGSIGVAFTYLTWLYVASFCFLATALLGQVIATDPGTLGRRVRGEPALRPGPPTTDTRSPRAPHFTQTG